MNYCKVPPVLDSKLVLLNHIQAKLKQFVSVSLIANDLAVEICESRSNDEIISLLQDEKSLLQAIFNIKRDSITKEKLGAELFLLVSHFDTSLSAQITGMLLDLDVLTICKLLDDSAALENAVLKAKEEYLKFQESISKEALGEKIYLKALTWYPDEELASRLTGMLLELGVSELRLLLDDSDEIVKKLRLAHEALQ